MHTDLSTQISSQIASLSCLNPHWLPRSNGIIYQLHPLPHLPRLFPHEIYSFHLPNLTFNVFLHHLVLQLWWFQVVLRRDHMLSTSSPFPCYLCCFEGASKVPWLGSALPAGPRLNITSSPTSPEVQWLRLCFHCRGQRFDPWSGN